LATELIVDGDIRCVDAGLLSADRFLETGGPAEATGL
jgi:hypothetical protein